MPSLSSKDRKYLGGWIKDTAATQRDQYGGFGDRFKGYGEEAYDYGTGTRDWVTEQYKNLFSGLTGAGAPAPAGRGGGGGGGPKGPDPADQTGYLNWYKNVGQTGASSPEQLDTLRGYGLFKNFANTGGFDEGQKQDFRARSLAGVPSLYDGMRRDLGQRMAVTGGYGPGFDFAGSQIARDRSRAIGDASLGAETNLANMIRENQKWGATSGSGAEQQILGNQFEGTGQASSLAKTIQQQRNAAAAARNAGAQNDFRNQMAILSELRGLRGETGAEMDYGRMELGGYGGFGDSQARGQQMFNESQKRNSFMENLGQVAGIAGNLGGAISGVAGAFGGGGGGGVPKPGGGGGGGAFGGFGDFQPPKMRLW